MKDEIRDWRKLRVGDRVRIVSVHPVEQQRYEQGGGDFTVRVLRRLVKKRSIRTIAWIDDLGYPWFNYSFRHRGKMEDHSMSLGEGDWWVSVKPKRRR